MSEDDICWDESGFSAGAGAPKAKPATDAESVKAIAENIKMTVSFRDVELAP